MTQERLSRSSKNHKTSFRSRQRLAVQARPCSSPGRRPLGGRLTAQSRRRSRDSPALPRRARVPPRREAAVDRGVTGRSATEAREDGQDPSGPAGIRRDPPGSARTRQDPPGPAGCVVVGRSPPQPREDGPGARSATACRRRPPGAPASLTAEPRARSARCPVWTFRSSPDGRVRQRREGGSPGRAALLRPLRRGGTRTALSAAGLWREPLRDRARRFLKSVWKSTPARSRGGPSPRPRPTASRVVD